MAVTVEIVRRKKEDVARPVTRDGKDRELRMRDHDVTPESTRLDVSQHTTPAGIDNTTVINGHTTT